VCSTTVFTHTHTHTHTHTFTHTQRSNTYTYTHTSTHKTHTKHTQNTHTHTRTHTYTHRTAVNGCPCTQPCTRLAAQRILACSMRAGLFSRAFQWPSVIGCIRSYVGSWVVVCLCVIMQLCVRVHCGVGHCSCAFCLQIWSSVLI
jgi:hypothetical protein